jgi:hypothetical protein
MNKDFRVSVSLTRHPKYKKLLRLCGDIACHNLLCLWTFVAQNRPDGNLTGLDVDDIEIASEWNGQCSMFYQALLDLRFIDVDGDTIKIHDWEDHNGYASHAKERSDKAKKAAEARWNSKNKCYEHAPSNATSIKKDATSNAPSPSPSPTPNKLKIMRENDFNEWYKAYPLKKSKQKAISHWNKYVKSGELPELEILLAALENQTAERIRKKQRNQFCPEWKYPDTWLNKKCWEDETESCLEYGEYDPKTRTYNTHDGNPEVVI